MFVTFGRDFGDLYLEIVIMVSTSKLFKEMQIRWLKD